LAKAVTYIAFLMRHKTQWCSERVKRQAPYGNLSFGRVGLNILEQEKKQLLPLQSVRILALVIRNALRMRRVILLLCIVFLHIVSYSTRFSVKYTDIAN